MPADRGNGVRRSPRDVRRQEALERREKARRRRREEEHRRREAAARIKDEGRAQRPRPDRPVRGEQGKVPPAAPIRGESAADKTQKPPTRRRLAPVGKSRVETAGVPSEAASRVALELRTVASDLAYAPAGLFRLGKDALADALWRKPWERTGSRTTRNLRAMAESTAEVLRDPLKPGNTGRALVTVAGVAAPVASGGARTSAAARAARGGAGVRGVARELVRHPKPGEAFGKPREFRLPGDDGETLAVPSNYSRSPLFELIQRGSDAVRHRFPNAGFSAGPAATRNLPGRAGFELEQNRRVTDALDSADALGLAAKTRLSKRPRKRHRQHVAQTAARTEFEGASVADRIRFHEERASAAKSSTQRRRHERKAALLRKAAPLVEETPNGPRVTNAQLRALMDQAERVAAKAEASRIERGVLDHGRAAGRVQAPGRIVAGARYVKPTPGRVGKPSRSLKQARARVDRLQKRFERRLAKEEARAQLTRPRSRREAEEFIRQVDEKYEQLVAAEVSRIGGIAKGAVAKRNAIRNVNRRGMRDSDLRRRDAERELQRKLREATHPAAVRLRDQLEEADRLRAMLQTADTERAFGGGRQAPLQLGRVERGRNVSRPVLERLGGALSVAKDDLERFERAAAGRVQPTGIVGADDFDRGTVRVPYTARGEHTPIGRARLGSSDVVGVPKEAGVVTQAFRGGRLLSGNFRDDALRLIAEDALVENRQTSKLTFRREILKASTGERQSPSQIAVRVGPLRDPRTTSDLRDALARPDDVMPSRAARRATDADPFRQLREALFPTEIDGVPVADIEAGTRIPGIRWVDERLLEGANKPPAGVGIAETPGLRELATAGRGLNNAMRLAIFYTAPKYLPPNILGQAALNYIQQGKSVPKNWRVAARAAKKIGPEPVAVIDEAMGGGLGRSIGGSGRGPLGGTASKAGELWSVVLDRMFRRAAWVHEARAAGFKTPDAMADLATNPAHRDTMIRVTRRGRDEILDYERLGRFEHALTGFLFIYPFTKASTVYVGHFLTNHPMKAAIAEQFGVQGKDEVRRILGDVPSFGEGLIPIERDGKTYVSNPAAFTPLGPGLSVAQAAASSVAGQTRPSELPVQYLSPALRAAVNAAINYDPFFGRKLDARDSDPKQFVDELVRQTPQYRLIEGLRGKKAGRDDVIYPTTPREAVGQFVGGTIVPRQVNPRELQERAAQEERSLLDPVEREYRKAFEERKQFFAEARRVFPQALENGRLPKPLRESFNRKAQRFASYKQAGLRQGDADYQRRAYEVDVRLFQRWGLASEADARAALRWARTADVKEIEKQRRSFSFDVGPYGKAYLQTIRYARKALEQRGAKLD